MTQSIHLDSIAKQSRNEMGHDYVALARALPHLASALG
jgi:hypothetical protein